MRTTYILFLLLLGGKTIAKTNDFCQKEIILDSSEHYFIYSHYPGIFSNKDITSFSIERMKKINGDTFSRVRVNLNFNSEQQITIDDIEKNIVSYFFNTDKNLVDTLIFYKNSVKKNGEAMIDTLLPIYDSLNLWKDIDILSKNSYYYKEKAFINKTCIGYRYQYIPMMSSSIQYSYLYLRGFWIVEYDFGSYYGRQVLERYLTNNQ